MGQKVKPIGMRVGINRTWDSRSVNADAPTTIRACREKIISWMLQHANAELMRALLHLPEDAPEASDSQMLASMCARAML